MELGNHLCVEGTRAGGQEAIRAIKGTLNGARAGHHVLLLQIVNSNGRRWHDRDGIVRLFYLSLKRSKIKRGTIMGTTASNSD